MLDNYEFALCLTHDVDRPFKTFQGPYYALKDLDPSHLRSLLSSHQPYWQFEEIMDLEDDMGVRSTFFFLNEQHLFRDMHFVDWFNPKNWKLFLGRYDITEKEIVQTMKELRNGGWEIGLHGSYESFDDRQRLSKEKSTLEGLLNQEITGCRQHYLNLQCPTTWKYQRDVGLKYDASLGSVDNSGFEHGYDTLTPFDDDFVVFPLTAMEISVMGDELEASKKRLKKLLREAAENAAVMTILWHPKYFNETEFPGYREAYKFVVTEADKMGAWIGPCGSYYQKQIEESE